MHDIVAHYPLDLLAASPIERLTYFASRQLVIRHPALDRTLEEVYQAIDPGLDQNLVVLVGTSGIGKTALTTTLVRRLNKEFLSRSPDDNVSIPAVWLEADAAERGAFDWKTLYVELLQELQMPFIESTLPLVERAAGAAGNLITTAPENTSRTPATASYRTRCRSAIRDRQCRLIAIDEAANLFRTKSRRSEADRIKAIAVNADIVRTLVNRSPATILLAGAFDLLDMVNANGQLARRCNIVHFPSYLPTEEGLEEYVIALKGLLSHFPAVLDPKLNLKVLTPILFEQSLGTVGLTRRILYKWLRYSLDFGKPMDMKLLKQCFFTKKALQTLREDLESGRERIESLS